MPPDSPVGAPPAAPPPPSSDAVQEVKNVISWSNYPGTLADRVIPFYATPWAVQPDAAAVEGGLVAHAQAVKELLTYCFGTTPPTPLRTLGSAWSFSRVLDPGPVALDTLHFTVMQPVPDASLTDGYKARRGKAAPVYVEGGTLIADVNRRLGSQFGLALQTSGAADGQRIAGAIATGTHGAARSVGALHDTVLGLHVMVAPQRAVYIQSSGAPACNDAFRQWLEDETGIPTDAPVGDPNLFPAALVALGSFGVVLGVVVEAVPLYQLEVHRYECPVTDPVLRAAIATQDLSKLPVTPPNGDPPWHFDVTFNPYPPSDGGAFVTVMWNVSADGVPFQSPSWAPPIVTSDLMSYVPALASALGSISTGLTVDVLRFAEEKIIGGGSFGTPPRGTRLFPGQAFGPTNLPKGQGISNELLVDASDAAATLQLVQGVVASMANQGQFLLGPLGLRFVKGTSALLGMNQFPLTCSLEMPSVRSEDVKAIYRAIWAKLDAASISFTCHWGQWQELDAARVSGFYGAKAAQWTASRKALLADPIAQAVFAAPLLGDVGL